MSRTARSLSVRTAPTFLIAELAAACMIALWRLFSSKKATASSSLCFARSCSNVAKPARTYELRGGGHSEWELVQITR